jgi:hypothetical protein
MQKLLKCEVCGKKVGTGLSAHMRANHPIIDLSPDKAPYERSRKDAKVAEDAITVTIAKRDAALFLEYINYGDAAVGLPRLTRDIKDQIILALSKQ